MRYMFGLVGLLVSAAIIAMLWAKYTLPMVKEGKKAQDQSRQIAGRDDNGTSVLDTFKVDPQPASGALRSLLVTDVTPGGGMAQYGLQKGDAIVSIRDLDVATIGDADSAKAQVMEAYRGQLPIVVLRAGQRVTLPAQAGAAGATTGAPAGSPGQSAQQQMKSIQDQIRVPTH